MPIKKPVHVICFNCNKSFTKIPSRMNNRKQKPKITHYCSLKCLTEHNTVNLQIKCKWCGKSKIVNHAKLKKSKSGNMFCNQSCAASYNNTQRRKSRRSKCEIILFNMLCAEFSNIEFLPNNKSMLNGYEIDIAVPSLNLGIEWNGIVHYKPIYGEEKLLKIQTIDQKKIHIAAEQNINLIIIPDLVSTTSKISEAYHQICSIIKEISERQRQESNLHISNYGTTA